jgi:cubilin
VTFRSFSVESTQDCSYDFLQIHDGPNAGAHNLGRFCGNSLPKGGVIITTHHQIYLWFKSDHSVTGEGFQLDWNTTNPGFKQFYSAFVLVIKILCKLIIFMIVCGGQLGVREYGSVNSPGYPGNYAHNRDCFWYFV